MWALFHNEELVYYISTLHNGNSLKQNYVAEISYSCQCTNITTFTGIILIPVFTSLMSFEMIDFSWFEDIVLSLISNGKHGLSFR